jgi:hypothetical protein
MNNIEYKMLTREQLLAHYEALFTYTQQLESQVKALEGDADYWESQYYKANEAPSYDGGYNDGYAAGRGYD